MTISLLQCLELLAITIAIGIATFGASLLPVKYSSALSQSKLTYLTYFSSGVLLGTSFLIILPEGIEVLADADSETNTTSIGYPMLIGYVLMYIIEKFTSEIIPSTPTESRIDETSGDSGHIGFVKDASGYLSVIKSSITLGLVVHGSVDGISLGSAFLNSRGSFRATIVFAIIIHRLPTAISLGAILSKEGWVNKVIYMHTSLFALLTPVFAWITVIVVSLLHIDLLYTTAILLLFSTGTFFYVVTHVMNEFDYNSSGDEINEWADVPGSSSSNSTILNKSDNMNIIFRLLGLLVPVVISFIRE